MTNKLDYMKLYPENFILVCPKCGCSCNAKYLLSLMEALSFESLSHFYCPKHKFVTMELKEVYQTSILFRIKSIFIGYYHYNKDHIISNSLGIYNNKLEE
jgi:hypothetical protein